MQNQESFTCSRCGQTKQRPEGTCGTGYAINSKDEKICYACCGDLDKEQMEGGEPSILYLTVTKRGKTWQFSWYHITAKLTNWPGSLEINPVHGHTGRHNIAGIRYDVWFEFAGHKWHGVTYGDNTQLCHCKTVKSF